MSTKEERIFDFDLWRAERDNATMDVKVGGVIHKVTLNPPAYGVLLSLRIQKAVEEAEKEGKPASQELSAEEVIETAQAVLFPSADAIISTPGLSLQSLWELCQVVALRQTAASSPKLSPQEPPTTEPQETPSTSSSTGDSSKQTSNESTGSTSK